MLRDHCISPQACHLLRVILWQTILDDIFLVTICQIMLCCTESTLVFSET